MDGNDSYLNPNTICNGCLSIERKLTDINSVKVSSLFSDLPNSFKKPRIYLCWECIAIIARIIKFQQQVKLASDYLQQQVVTRANISSLSNLVKTETISLEYSINIKKNISSRTISVQNLQTQTVSPFQESLNVIIQNESPYSLENGDQSQNLCEPLKYVCDREEFNVENGEGSPYFESHVKDDETTNLEENHFTFIKVEDDNDVCDENIHQEVYDEDLKTVFNHDTDTEKDVKDVSNEGDYNESDDEPLLKKKKKHAGARRRNCEQQPGVVSHPRVEKILKKLNVDQSQLELVVLGWDEIESERNKASQSVTYSGQKYKCPDCILGFNYKFKLDNHMKKHDEAAGNVVCSVCNVRFKSDTAMRAHLRRHQMRWRCRICGDLSSRAPVAADHVARIHGASAPVHTCRTCGHKESSLTKLRSHLRNHKQRPKCDLCGKSFLSRASLKAHLFIHFGVKEYSCSHCEKRFLFKKAMEIHVMTHDPSAQLYCHQCDMNFKNRMSYDRHMKYNLKHVDPSKLKHACKLCDKKFLKATRLHEHNMAVHLNAKPISCTTQDCAFTCSSRAVLRTHVRMVHRNARTQRNHVCHTCGKAYTTKKTLEGHMRSHSGERPFRCPLCPSTFGYEAALYNHNKLVHLKTKIRSTSYGQQAKDVEKLNAS